MSAERLILPASVNGSIRSYSITQRGGQPTSSPGSALVELFDDGGERLESG
jgi:hypothetical protein